MLRSLFSACRHELQEVLLPFYCLLCRDRSDCALDLCTTCQHHLPRLKHSCYRCANPLPTSTHLTCPFCLKYPPAFDRIRVLYRHESAIRDLINGLKFRQEVSHAHLLASLMSQMIEPEDSFRFDLIMPVPLHRKRLRERGFNQALEIAKPLAKQLDIPIDYHSCYRRRHTIAQSTLSFKARHQNLKEAFAVKNRTALAGKRILLIDDVVTTTATVNLISQLLRQQGVEQVEVWAASRRVPHNIP